MSARALAGVSAALLVHACAGTPVASAPTAPAEREGLAARPPRMVPCVETRTLPASLAEAGSCVRVRALGGRLHFEPDGASAAGAASFTTAEIVPAQPFRDLIVSWNVTTPPGAGFRVELCVARENGEWSPWMCVGDWGDVPELSGPLECTDGQVDTDYFRGNHDLARARFRIRALGRGPLVLERWTACFSNRELSVPSGALERDTQALHLDVRPRSQHAGPPGIAARICSPTSLAMVLDYRGVPCETAEVAARAFDRDHDLYGNWPRNVQAAWSFGVPGYVTRIASLDEARELIEHGTPIVASIGVRAGELRGAPYLRTDGHLIVITGFDGRGGVRVNDPAAADADQAALVYAAEDLERVWLARGGTAYVLLPRP